MERLWGEEAEKGKKGKYKRDAKSFVERMEEIRWEEWRMQQKDKKVKEQFVELNSKKGRESYTRMKRKERRLIAVVRLGDTLYDRERRGHCVMCGSEEEGSKHLVVSCEKFEARREKLVGEGGRSWIGIMTGNQEELLKFLEWIQSMCRVFGGQGLVEKEEEECERERGEEVGSGLI